MALKAYVQYTSKGIIIPMSLRLSHSMPKDGIWKQVPESLCCSTIPFQMISGDKLKAFIKYDSLGRAIPGSLIVVGKQPLVGNWKQIPYSLCCTNVGPTTTTTSTSTTSTTSTSTTTTTTTAVGTFPVKFGYAAVDPTAQLQSGVDSQTYQGTLPLALNAPIVVTLNPPASNWTFIAIPPGQYDVSHVPNTWFNTSLNQGTIPDSAFLAIFTNPNNSYTYILTRNNSVVFDNTTPTTFSHV